MDRYMSRKLQLAVAGILTILGAAFAGEISWEGAVTKISVIVVGYLFVNVIQKFAPSGYTSD